MAKFKNIAACVIGVSVAKKNGELEMVGPGKVIECEESDVSYRLERGQFELVGGKKPKAEDKAA
jgi:hypothetical protein